MLVVTIVLWPLWIAYSTNLYWLIWLCRGLTTLCGVALFWNLLQAFIITASFQIHRASRTEPGS